MNPIYKFYSDKAFAVILKLVEEKKYDKALTWYQQYFDKYPNDVYGYINYADLLIKIGQFHEANNIINKYEDIFIKNKVKEYYAVKMKLLCCMKKYSEAYDFILENSLYFDLDGIKKEIIFLKKQLGLLTDEDYKIDIYTILQIIEYSEDRFYNHIENHLYQSKASDTSYFVEDFPIREVVEKVKELIPIVDRIYISPITTLRIFKYENNGISIEGQPADYIEVVSMVNDDTLLTMFPYLNKEKSDAFDITPVEAFNLIDNPKTKRLSQIEKFNKRYCKN